MPDIFLSYNREDQARAKVFAEAFGREGFDVWWDVTLRSGEAYDQVTEKALREAKAVIVLWSKKSVDSRWVRAEATLADRNRTLVPVMIEVCERPIMFELTQTADLTRWQGDSSDRAWQVFLADVHRLVGGSGPAPTSALAQPALGSATATPTPIQRGGRPSLAILPFNNRSGERADDVFAGGMVEDIIAALSLGRGLKVIAQSATYTYRKNVSDLRSIGQELGARYIMEGNIRRVGDTLRVTAQLVEAENGAILWTQKFDRPLAELAYLQEELVTEVANHLGVQIQRVEMERALKKPGDITAWEAVMRSWAAYAKLTQESMKISVAEARRAVALAPDYAVAQASLGMALGVLYQTTAFRDKALLGEAIHHAELALELNANNATVLFQVANVMCQAARFAEMLQYAQRAVDLNPSLADARHALAAALNHFERYDEALAHLDEADRLAPRGFSSYLSNGHRCWAHFGAGRLDLALQAVERLLTHQPTEVFGRMSKAVVLDELGRREDAQAAMRQMRKLHPAEPLDFWLDRISGSYMAPPDQTRYLAIFRKVWEATPTN